MPWARVDDGWWCHPKVLALSLPARGLWVSALSWSCAHRSPDVPMAFLATVGAKQDEANELTDAGLWDATDKGWRFHDWANYQDVSAKRREAGRKGGVASGESRRSKAEANEANVPVASEATGKQTPKQARPVPSRPEPEGQEISSEPSASLELVPTPSAPASPERQTYPDDFEAFWQRYPRKTGKGAAAKAFAKATKGPGVRAGRVVLAARRHADAWARWPESDRQFIPHPATWLNEARYDDPPPEARRPSGPVTKADRNQQAIAESVARMTGGGAS